jgi:hypothetical protein
MPNFAALEARLNRTVADHLANRAMVFTGGTVPVCFADDDMDNAQHRLPKSMGIPRSLNLWHASAPAADFAGVVAYPGIDASIDGVTYRITEVNTDASGWMTLTLRKS